MSTAARHDAWSAGDGYDAYMGRWSRLVAAEFVDGLGVPAGRDWLEVGCGTGALSATIVERAAPSSLLGIEPSLAFVEAARARVRDARARFVVGEAAALPCSDGNRDVVVSGLVLNFVPDRQAALREMRRVLRPDGLLAFYVWDYPAHGVGFMDAFWRAAVHHDPGARELTEDARFPDCTAEALETAVRGGGFGDVQVRAIEVETAFAGFDDLWRPFTLGVGPAPGYCASLDETARRRLEATLRASLPVGDDGRIVLGARAWAVRGYLC